MRGDKAADECGAHPGFEFENVAVIIGRQARAPEPEGFLAENAFSLLMYAAKQTMAALITIEQGVMTEADAMAKLELVFSEVVKYLDE